MKFGGAGSFRVPCDGMVRAFISAIALNEVGRQDRVKYARAARFAYWRLAKELIRLVERGQLTDDGPIGSREAEAGARRPNLIG